MNILIKTLAVLATLIFMMAVFATLICMMAVFGVLILLCKIIELCYKFYRKFKKEMSE